MTKVSRYEGAKPIPSEISERDSGARIDRTERLIVSNLIGNSICGYDTRTKVGNAEEAQMVCDGVGG